jgi:hypothetical protein
MNLEKFQYSSSKGLSLVMEKHGEHDQKTHGNWSTGGTVYTSIIDRISRKDVTGFSLDISSRSEPTSGYMCSNNGAEQTVDYKDFFSSRDRSREVLLDYIEKNADALSERGAYFGIWVVKDQGTVYLDVSRRYDSRGEAVRAGFDNEQQSVYDIEKDDYIYMKDEEDDRTRKAVDGGGSNPRQSNDSRGEASLRGGDSQRNREESPHVCLGRYQGVEKHLEGQHDQATHGSWASGRFGADSVKSARDGAKEYAFKAGITQDDSIDYQKTVANRARAGRIADAYDELPTVQEEAFPAYEALATEVEAQFEYMTKTMGIKVEFVDADPYKTSREMFADASQGVLKVLRTASTGSHPFFSDEQNDKFRAVHDFFGHAATGRGFGQDGEESAWVHHSQMFTETARGALTTETRGQNSWYNTRGQGFAEQKVALLPKEFWEVPKTFEKRYKVIKFQAGLIPILKHQEHDQSTHGSWAKGISDEDEELINQMSTMGPAKEDILNAISGAEQAGMDDLTEYVNNNQAMYNEAIDGIDERVAERLANLQAEFPNHEYTEQEKSTIYEDIQAEMIQEYIESDDGTIAVAWQEENGGSFNPEDLHGYFDEVYGMSHEITNNAGEVVTVLGSETTNIYTDDGSLVIQGQVTDSDGNFAGEFQRSFYKETNSNGEEVLIVEHDLFRMAEEYQGGGFGTKFLAQQEAYYVSKGIDAIAISTAWDGARHWARAGFDFSSKSIDRNISMIADQIAQRPSVYGADTEAGKEFDALMSRTANGYTRDSEGRPTWGSIKSMKENGFPTPNDFAMIGYGKRVQSGTSEYGKPIYSWDGKNIMDGLFLKYRKGLTQEGRTLNQGPIDRDGDGLVFDGTAREKPVSEVN